MSWGTGSTRPGGRRRRRRGGAGRRGRKGGRGRGRQGAGGDGGRWAGGGSASAAGRSGTAPPVRLRPGAGGDDAYPRRTFSDFFGSSDFRVGERKCTNVHKHPRRPGKSGSFRAL